MLELSLTDAASDGRGGSPRDGHLSILPESAASCTYPPHRLKSNCREDKVMGHERGKKITRHYSVPPAFSGVTFPDDTPSPVNPPRD